MANNRPGYGEMVQCPICGKWDIRREQLQWHLVRCNLANPDNRLEMCRFDATHRIRAEEMAVS